MSAAMQLPSWARDLWQPARYKAAYGGRGSGKTWTVATVLVLMAAERKMRIACCREFQSSIHESAKRTIEIAISRLGCDGLFDVQRQRIVARNGSEFFFHGFERSREAIRGWEDVDIVWVEEAQRMTAETWEVLAPSIRKQGEDGRHAEIWFTFNPRYRTDPVWLQFGGGPREGVQAHFVNWYHNPWFPDVLEQERQDCLRDEPDRYAHIWEGQPDDEGATRKVFPYALGEACVRAHEKGLSPAPLPSYKEAGLDVADTGADRNALAVRAGPVLYHAERWHAPVLGHTARRCDAYMRSNGIDRLNYDVGGIGAGIRSHLAEMTTDYSIHPILFGGEVKGKKRRYSYKGTNEQHFQRRNSQLGWVLRIRGLNTQRLMDGDDDIAPEKCLFIDPAIPRLETFLGQLSQPEWDDGQTGKIRILKQPEEEPSPDLYDAAVLAFARDSDRGIRIN